MANNDWNSKWGELGLHAATIFTISSVGVVLHHFHAPTEITTLIFVFDTFYVAHVVRSWDKDKDGRS